MKDFLIALGAGLFSFIFGVYFDFLICEVIGGIIMAGAILIPAVNVFLVLSDYDFDIFALLGW